MLILDKGRDILSNRLRQAIQTGQSGDQFMHDLVLEWRAVHVPVFTNLGDRFVNGLKADPEIIRLLSEPKSRDWLKKNIDSMLDYLEQLSQS